MEYYGDPDAESVLIVMGSAALTCEAVVAKLGRKVGVVNIRLWRPFDMEYFVSKIPKTVKKIAVLDRARDHTSNGELLYKEVVSCLYKKNLL